MIDSKQMFGKGKNDEKYTPAYAVRPLLEFIPSEAVIWCPFDTKESEFVKVLSKTNKVIRSHIWDDQDFYNYQPSEHWDMIISNPPFTCKRLIFERALSFGRPFALLMTMAWLNDTGWINAYNKFNADVQLLAFDKRIRYADETGFVDDKITFSTGYYCLNFLPKAIETRRLVSSDQLTMDFTKKTHPANNNQLITDLKTVKQLNGTHNMDTPCFYDALNNLIEFVEIATQGEAVRNE